MYRLLIFAMLLASPGFAQGAPSTAQLLEGYVKALGGAEKLRAVNTRIMQGTLENSDDGSTAQLEIRTKAPNRYAMAATVSGQGAARTVFAGDAGWNLDPDSGVRTMNRSEVTAAARDYDFHRELRLAELYPKMAAPRKSKLGEADVWVIEAEPAAGEPEKLWFDAGTGLLVNREYQHTSLEDGIILYQEFYEDYKDVDGVKLPHRIRRVTPDYELTFRFTKIQLNAPVDDGAFAKPAK